MKKWTKKIIFLLLLLLLIFKIFPKLGVYTFLFDRGTYSKSYNPPDEIISDLNELTPKTRQKAELFLELCHAEGLYPKITETYRTQERQNYLYEQGRSRDGKVVTWTRDSRHTKRYAFDICKEGANPYDDEEFFRRCAEIGKSIGLTPGYYWSEYQDMPHYQYDAWWTP